LLGTDIEKHDNDTIVASFRKRLKGVAGFTYVPEPLPMRNSAKAVMYYLFLRPKSRWPTTSSETFSRSIGQLEELGPINSPRVSCICRFASNQANRQLSARFLKKLPGADEKEGLPEKPSRLSGQTHDFPTYVNFMKFDRASLYSE
jgi:hypothetical protein